MGDGKEQNLQPQSVKELWNIDWKIGSVLQGDCYRAVGVQDKDDVVIWVSRDGLSQANQELFLSHVEGLLSVREWVEVDYGIDADSRAFVVLGQASTKSIDFDAPSSITLRNRFLMSVVLIAQLHEAGVACGNITLGSFVVDSLSKVQFVGFLGGYAGQVTSSVPLDMRACLVPEEEPSATPSVAADAYSLAVMGLALYGAQFPPTTIDVKHIDEYLEKVRPDAPPWVLSVLATIVRESSRKLCRDANDMLRLIAAKDADYLVSLREKRGKDSSDIEDEKPLSLDEIRELFITAEQLRKRRIDSILQSKIVRRAVAGVVGVAGIVFIAVQAAEVRDLIPQASSLKRTDKAGRQAMTEVAGALVMLRGMEAPQGAGSSASRNKVNEESPAGGSAGLSGAEGNAEPEPPKKIRIEPDNVLLAHVSSGAISVQDREAVLSLYPQVDDQSKVLLALAFIRAGGEAEKLFRGILEKQVQPSVLANPSTPPQLSTDALFLAAEMRLSRDAVTLWGREDRLSEQEVLWLGQSYAKKRSPAFPYLAKVIVERDLVSWPHSIFLEVAAQAEDSRAVPYEALFRSAREGATNADTSVITAWSDPLSTRALLAVLASSKDPEVADSALNGIMTKPGLDDVLRAVLEALSAVESRSGARFAKLVSGVGLADSCPGGALEQGLEELRGDPSQEAVLGGLLAKAPPKVIGAVLRVYGRDIHPDTLIHLLDRPEAAIRKDVIPFLKEVRIASSKRRIREKYEMEQNSEVRVVFEAELYPTS